MRSSGVQSRWRNLHGKGAQSHEQYRGIALGSLYLEENPLRAGATLLALPWNTPRGSVAVIPRTPHALSEDTPTLRMAEPINGFDMSPHRDALLLCACEDGTLGLFDCGPAGLTADCDTPTALLEGGHERRALGVRWHPHVAELAASHCGAKVVTVWDVAGARAAHSLPALPALLQSLELRGALALTLAKDKTLRTHDLRAAGPPAQQGAAVHAGARGGHAYFTADTHILSVGFGAANREAKLFDTRKGLAQPVAAAQLDGSSSSALFAQIDEDLQLAYVWGKGDGNTRIFDLANGALLECAELKAATAQSGLALLPKRALTAAQLRDGAADVLYKLTPTTIDVVQVLQPRAGAGFFDDALHPPTWDGAPRGTAAAFLQGAELAPATRVSLNPDDAKQ